VIQKPDFKKLEGKGLFEAGIIPGYTIGDGRTARLVTAPGARQSFSAEDLWANLHKVANRAEAVAWLGLEPEKVYPGFKEMDDLARAARNEELAQTVGLMAREMLKTLMPEIVSAVRQAVAPVDVVATDAAATRPSTAGPRRAAGAANAQP
jgi:hypothetical protein